VLYAQTGDHVGADPRHYYEDVAPSDWKPETPETCTELHRRAYCGYADAVFPVLFVALVGAACAFHLLSPGLLLVALPVVFVLGLQVVVVSGQPVLRVNCCNPLHIVTAAVYRQHNAYGWETYSVIISSTVLSWEVA